ncbi:hypothetical protein BDW42DRAFT_173190 [Aspergillus taichungensis]|uniref:Uncharacterized protein n=1 Tax=Aspergillus taichungensis TaxID=482145 RepID=A0A2J5HPZ5_9EURO|nr:hypothetical protein BDW42DRAFT_173190 [Aspergillus taichungensis]
MSGMGEERWRGGRQYDQNRHHGQQKHSLNRTMSAHSNARGGQGYNNASNNWGDSRDLSAGLSPDQHVPVRGFNATESKTALKKNPGGPRPFFYKLGKDAGNRPSGPWGSKPNTMANGKDFFLELRKQMTTLQQGGNTAGG